MTREDLENTETGAVLDAEHYRKLSARSGSPARERYVARFWKAKREAARARRQLEEVSS